MSVSKSIYLTLDELKEWLASTEPFEPPIGHERFKKITLMMAITALMKSIREKPRRMKQEIHDAICDVEEALENFEYNRAESLLKYFLQLIAKEPLKTCPVQLPPVKVLLYAMADNKMISPPKNTDIKTQILNTRAVLYCMSKTLAKHAEKEIAKENQEQSLQTETNPESPSSEQPPEPKSEPS